MWDLRCSSSLNTSRGEQVCRQQTDMGWKDVNLQGGGKKFHVYFLEQKAGMSARHITGYRAQPEKTQQSMKASYDHCVTRSLAATPYLIIKNETVVSLQEHLISFPIKYLATT